MKKKLLITATTLSVILSAYGYYFFQREIPHFQTVVKNELYRSGQARRLGLHYIRAHPKKSYFGLNGPSFVQEAG